MPSQAYYDGYEDGKQVAGLCPLQILATKTREGLAKLAGHRIEIARRQMIGLWWIKSGNPDWPLGFFDGFMVRAEEIYDAGQRK